MVYLKLKHGIVALKDTLTVDVNRYEYVDTDGEVCGTPLGDIGIKIAGGDDVFTVTTFPNTIEGEKHANGFINRIWEEIKANQDKENVCIDVDVIRGEFTEEGEEA